MKLSFLSVLLLVLASVPLWSGPITLNQKYDVNCHDIKCGEITFTVYDPVGTPDAPFAGGAEIRADFRPIRPLNYHYIQAVISDQYPQDWVDGSKISPPYIDTPPGGYKNYKGDYRPYYDTPGSNPPFPQFFDSPLIGLNALMSGKKQDISFEAWLVCVILQKDGPNAKQASDDNYKVAPLFGWTWGFTAEFKDNGDKKLNADDINVTLKPLNNIDAPSADFKKALGQKYGAAGNQDFFNVELGDCKDCFPAPEPGTLSSVAVGLLFCAAWVRCRRRG